MLSLDAGRMLEEQAPQPCIGARTVLGRHAANNGLLNRCLVPIREGSCRRLDAEFE